MVRKGSAEDSEGIKRIQEFESFKKRQEVPGKHFWMLEVSGGLEKCINASQGGLEGSEGCKVRKPGRCRKVMRKNSIR